MIYIWRDAVLTDHKNWLVNKLDTIQKEQMLLEIDIINWKHYRNNMQYTNWPVIGLIGQQVALSPQKPVDPLIFKVTPEKHTGVVAVFSFRLYFETISRRKYR